MNLFQALSYFGREATRNLVRGWRISSLAVATTALSLLVGGCLILAGSNLTRAVERWRSDAQVVVMLEDGLPATEISALVREASEIPGVEEVVLVDSAQAEDRFRARFPDLAQILSELERSPFPVSIEIKAKSDGPEFGAELSKFGGRPGVDSIDEDSEWLESMNAAAAVASGLGLLVGGVLIFAAAVSIASVVRLSTFVYRKEIATMRLIGATEFFVRGPFVVEGLLQGVAGACVALGALWTAFWGLGRLDLPWFVRDALLDSFLSPRQALALLVVGGLAGLVGGIIPLRERSGVFG